MDSRYKYVQCRLCLYRSGCLSDIFEKSSKKGIIPAELITELLQLKVKYHQRCTYCVSNTDDYPQLICLECLDKLIYFRRFKEQCLNAKSSFEKNIHSNVLFINVSQFTNSDTLESDVFKSDDEMMVESNSECSNPVVDILHTRDINNEKINSAICTLDVTKNHDEKSKGSEPTFKLKEISDLLSFPIEIKQEEVIITSDIEKSIITSPQLLPVYQTDSHVPEQKSQVNIFSDQAHHLSSQDLDNTATTGKLKASKRHEKKVTFFECNKCDEKYTQKRQLNSHFKEQHQEKPNFLCETCGKVFKQKVIYIHHLRIHSGQKPFVCQICGSSFAHSGSLWSHKMSRHMPKFCCTLCPRKFRREEKLKLHLAWHSRGKFPCGKCWKTFAREKSLLEHHKQHSGDIPFKCDTCGKTFNYKKLLGNHVKRHNESDKKFKCHLCNRSFSIESLLKNHMTLHTGERPYMCEECGKKFRQRKSLTVHKRVHTGEKPYECRLCARRFTQKGSLNAHMKLHNS